MLWNRPVVLTLALCLALAGCIKGGDESTAAPTVDLNETPEQNATLPDGRGESAGLLETNNTEEGVGGVEHTHDYWKGETRVVLFDDVVSLSCPPCMPDGEGTSPKSVAYVKLGELPGGEEDALVYEGAASVEVLFGAPSVFGVADHPSPPAIMMQYRTAADSDWRTPMPVAFGTPIVLEVTPQETDMPHSTHSLWVWRLTTDRPEFQLDVPMTVTAVKGREVLDWPGHPEFYADKNERIVMDQHVTTHMSGLESFALYDSGGTWANPEKLVSWGTKELHVYLNVTKVTNAYNADATGIFLEAHNATVIGPEITFGERYFDDAPDAVKQVEFFVPVDEEGMDGPYQPASRWGFRAMATFAEVGDVTGLCPGCFPYDIEYDIVVIAMDHESGNVAEQG